MKSLLILICSLFIISILNSGKAQSMDQLEIRLSDKTSQFTLQINGHDFEDKISYRKLKKVLGKPSRVEKKRVPDFSGNYTFWDEIKSVFGIYRNTQSYYYTNEGIVFRGKNRRNITSVKIYYDTTNTRIPNLRAFTGDLFINDEEVNKDLSLVAFRSYGKSREMRDPLSCGRRCSMFNTNFQPSYQSVYYNQIRNRKRTPVIELSYFMDNPEIVEVHYYTIR